MNAVLSPESVGRPPLAIPPIIIARVVFIGKEIERRAQEGEDITYKPLRSRKPGSLRDAKLVRDLVRDLERVNCGELERTDFFIRIETYV